MARLTATANACKILRIINFVYDYFSIILTATYIGIHPDISMTSFYLFLLHAYFCAPPSSRGCGGQKRASNPLGIELQTVLSHHVSAGN